jgi:hypothetical protein
VTFLADPTMASDDHTPVSFSLTTNGTLCASVEKENSDGNERHSLTTALGTATWTYGDIISLSCPDGSVYEAEQLAALNCHGFGDQFAEFWVSSATSFQFTILSKPTNVDIVSCAK